MIFCAAVIIAQIDCTVGLVSFCKGLFFKWIGISAIFFPKIILVKQYCYRKKSKNAAPLTSVTTRKNRKDKLSLICNSSHFSSKSRDLELFQRIPVWGRNFVVWSKQTNKVENHETEVCLFWFYCVSPLLIIYSSCLLVPLEGQFSIARWHGCLKKCTESRFGLQNKLILTKDFCSCYIFRLT